MFTGRTGRPATVATVAVPPDAVIAWRGLLAAGVVRMQSAGIVDGAADPNRLAAAIQGGLVLSQPEGSGWPLEAALDHALHVPQSAALRPG